VDTVKIKRISLDKLSKIQPSFGGYWGLYDTQKDIIYIEASLPTDAKPSSQSVLQHERGHAILHKLGINTHQEERFCWLWSLATSPKAGLTHMELELRGLIFGRLSWSRRKDRRAMMDIISDKLSLPLFNLARIEKSLK
jgi:hypothetical protein